MTKVFERVVNCVAGGAFEKLEHIQMPSLRVNSDEIIPKGLGQGSEAYIIDKVKAAICNGKDVWYSSSGKSAAAGQPWADLC